MSLRNVQIWKYDSHWARNITRKADVLFQVPGLLSWDCFICLLSLMVISLQQSPSELSLLQASGESPSPENQQTHDVGQWMEGCEHLQAPQSEVVCLCSDGKFGTERDEIHYCSILSRVSQCDGLLLCWMHQGSIICYPDFWGCQCWMVTLTAVSIMSSSGTSTLYVYAGANLWTEDIKFWKEDPANCRVIVHCWSSLCPCMTAKHRWERNSGSMSQ